MNPVDIMSQHYDETITPYIVLDNATPIMNSLPFNRALMGNKKLKKILRDHEVNDTVQDIMNIAFQHEQQLEVGDVVEWRLRDVVLNVVVLSHDKAFVKGVYVWVSTVGIIE